MSGVLYVFRVFWLPLASQILVNLLTTVATVAIGREWAGGALALGVLLGSFMTLVLHLYLLRRVARNRNIGLFGFFNWGAWGGVAKALRLSMPLIVQMLVAQWGVIVMNRVLSEMAAGTIAQFGYAVKLVTMVGIMPTSLATVIFPTFSAAYAQSNYAEFASLVMKAFRVSLLLTVPLASLLFVMRDSVVFLMFQWGTMSGSAVNEISSLFGILLFAAPAYVLAVLFNKIAFSMGDTKSPAVAQLISTLLITLLVPYAAQLAGVKGAVLAFSGFVWAEALSLLIYQAVRYGTVPFLAILRYLFLFGLLALCVGVVSFGAREALEAVPTESKLLVVANLMLTASMSSLLCYQVSKRLGIYEASELWEYIRWQGGRLLSSLSDRKD